jgi:histidinol-phosphate aminotransferase
MIRFREEIDMLPPYILGGKFSEQLDKHRVTRVVKLNSNEPAYGPFPDAIHAMQKAILNLHRLPDDGCPELRRKLSIKFSVPQENICVNAGSWEVLRLLALTCISRGDEVVLGWPTWPPVVKETQVMGAVCVPVPLRNHAVDLDAVLDKISRRTKMVYICSPNNPTGTVVARSAFEEYFAAVPDDVVTVVDEAYFEYNRDPRTCSATTFLASGKPLLVLRTFSKMYGLISARIGYGIASGEIIQNMEKCRPPTNVSLVAEAAAIASVDDEKEVARRAEANFEQKQFLYDEFDRMGLEHTISEGNFVWVDVKEDSMDVWARLLPFGVLVRPGKTYGSPTWLRVSVGLPEENKVFAASLQECLDRKHASRTRTGAPKSEGVLKGQTI